MDNTLKNFGWAVLSLFVATPAGIGCVITICVAAVFSLFYRIVV